MDFDDFYKRKNKYQKKIAKQNYYRNDQYRQQSYSDSSGKFDPIKLIESLKTNRKLKIVLLIIFIVVIGLVIGLIAILLPLIGTVLNYITENGFSGLADEVIKFLNDLWNGTK
ncbi:type IV secretory pathway component VirB8 [Flavobacterium sp. PL11]|jgi:type IV secretory pathway component VirB8|uniref:hypothetical protein n=1 Tax=Flavobacterium sp. PL11 TaxID=3071717 RepID=UPI002E08DCA6|nr:type IV secretory pathway component VirB8 [Flavobacterium sp. PL11]